MAVCLIIDLVSCSIAVTSESPEALFGSKGSSVSWRESRRLSWLQRLAVPSFSPQSLSDDGPPRDACQENWNYAEELRPSRGPKFCIPLEEFQLSPFWLRSRTSLVYSSTSWFRWAWPSWFSRSLREAFHCRGNDQLWTVWSILRLWLSLETLGRRSRNFQNPRQNDEPLGWAPRWSQRWMRASRASSVVMRVRMVASWSRGREGLPAS